MRNSTRELIFRSSIAIDNVRCSHVFLPSNSMVAENKEAYNEAVREKNGKQFAAQFVKDCQKQGSRFLKKSEGGTWDRASECKTSLLLSLAISCRLFLS